MIAEEERTQFRILNVMVEGGISWWQSKAGIFVGGNMRDRTERQIAIGHWRFENICGGRKLHVLLVV